MIDKTVRRVLESAFVAWVERERIRRGDACATEAEVETIKTDPLAFDRMLQGADAWEFYQFVCQAADQLRLAALEFPAEFALRGFPGSVFRVELSASYMSGSDVMLYTYVRRGDEWLAFCKGTPDELRREITALPAERKL
jgi:hypothetical protein